MTRKKFLQGKNVCHNNQCMTVHSRQQLDHTQTLLRGLVIPYPPPPNGGEIFNIPSLDYYNSLSQVRKTNYLIKTFAIHIKHIFVMNVIIISKS